MASLRPESAAALTAHRREAIRLAKDQEKVVVDKCLRAGEKPPGYKFDELIGKGSFGRVYKGRQSITSKVVAIKVLDVDDADFQAFGDMKDEQLRDFNREIQILRRAQESGAENLNQMIEALPVHSQLWLVCEYCPGGSVKTLMRATHDRLEEKYFIVVARELAKALRGLHQAGIMHRDVKAANVLIHENGGLQLCDFGIAAALEGHGDKRRTFVGTLHWMPPELWADKPEYSDEVDVWGYGCTLYECAMGTPPNSDVRERQQLKVRMRRLKQSIALPDKENFSQGLRALVKFALNPDAASRPSMQDILQHDFLLATEEKYPTSSLTQLVQQYYAWLFGGGHRVSLFMPGGAAAASEVPDDAADTVSDEWNFSMTQDFERRMSTVLDLPLPDTSQLDHSAADLDGDATPRAGAPFAAVASPPSGMTATEKANFELRVQRGAGLDSIFNAQKPVYEYKAKKDFVPIKEPTQRPSDLPFRAMAEDRPASIASVCLDLGDFDEDDYATAAPRTTDRDSIQTTYAAAIPKQNEPAFILPDAATIRAKRADSKGPREGSEHDQTPRRASDDVVDSTGSSWTSPSTPRLADAAEITPTQPANAHRQRDTMAWSFADAMTDTTLDGSSEIRPTDDVVNELSEEARKRAAKHNTMDWSFSTAMSQADDELPHEIEQQISGRHARPRPLLRTMTQPITSDEIQDAEDDYSRPSTSMSGTYSESSVSSTEFDPFGLDRGTSFEDGPGDAEFEDSGLSDFYGSRGQTMVPAEMSSPHLGSGSIPPLHMDDHMDEQRKSAHHQTTINEGAHTQPGASGVLDPPASSRLRSPRGQTSPRSLGHIRGNGSGVSRGSNSSIGSARISNNVSTGNSTGTGSGSSGTGLSTFSAGIISLPMPAAPSLNAMSGEASPTTIERELDRLLNDFHNALSAAADVVNDSARGRARHRKGESNSEWEDEE